MCPRSPPARRDVIYGYAFGNTSKGFIVYEASHNFLTGNTSEDVDAARVYGNFLLYSGINNRPDLTANVPTKMLSGSMGPVNLSIIMGTGQASLYCDLVQLLWRHIRQSQTNDQLTSLHREHHIHRSYGNGSHQLHHQGHCNRPCGRKNFVAKPVTIYPVMMTLTKTDYKQAVQKEELLQL